MAPHGIYNSLSQLAIKVAAPADDRLTLDATTTMLRFRRDERTMFDDGGYARLDGR